MVIFQTLSFLCSVDLQSVNRWLHHTTCLTCLTLVSVLIVEVLLLLGVIFHLFLSLFEHLVPLKNTCEQHGFISIHLLKHFKCLWQCFSKPDQNFLVNSLLSVHHLFLIVQCPEKEEVSTKACDENAIAVRNLRLQLYTPKICEMITQSTYPSFVHRSHTTPSPINFPTDRIYIYIYIYIYTERESIFLTTYLCLSDFGSLLKKG